MAAFALLKSTVKLTHTCETQLKFWWEPCLLLPKISQVKERGGDCIPVVCDSSKEDDIEALFERIKQEQNGRLDILINNAYAGVHVRDTEGVLYHT